MYPDPFTPYSCTFSGPVPRELWMDYDEADSPDPEDEDDSPDAAEDRSNSSADQHTSRFERLVDGVMGVLAIDLKAMDQEPRGQMVTCRQSMHNL